MATSNLKRKSIGFIEIQSGNGSPNHVASLGSTYTDADTGISYKNSNGGSSWDQQNAGGSSFTGGTVTGATIFTGGLTANAFSATTISGGTLFSGSTDLYSIFSPIGGGSSTYVQPGSNITTGGTANEPTVNLVASPSINSLSFSGTATGVALSATTISGGTLFSGSTDLYSIFSPIGGGSSTYVQPGSNITTGGTAGSPIVSLAASPSVNNLSFSGTATGAALSATTISGGTIYSGITELSQLFVQPDNTQTLTNKRITKRVVSVANSATPSINTDNGDIFRLTGLSQNVTSFTTNLTGAANHGDMFSLEITDNGVARTLAFGASFAASGTLALPTTTIISTLLKLLFQWNSATNTWTITAWV